MTRHHLLTVWNPLYGANSMEAHLRVLHDMVREHRGGRRAEDDIYVWWGKVRSQHRLKPLPHLDQVLALDTELGRDDPGPETHLYLTDYSSLYVAHLGEITTDDPRRSKAEKAHVPDYYERQQLTCDAWFRLWDIRRLVDGILPMVVHELRKLRNVRYENHPVSIYGGMVELPLLVTETEEHRYFDHGFREHYTGGRFWIEFDSERAGVGAVEQELREHMFGDRIWQAFGPTTRLFISTAEKLYRDHYTDMGFDFSPVIVEYCKAVEVRTNDLLWRALGEGPPADRAVNIKGTSVELRRDAPLSLRHLAELLAGDRARSQRLASRFENGGWFVDQFPAVLNSLAAFRGPAAHSKVVGRTEAVQWRNQLCGIGCTGHFVELARVQLRSAGPG